MGLPKLPVTMALLLRSHGSCADVSLRDEKLLGGDWLEQSAHSAVQTA